MSGWIKLHRQLLNWEWWTDIKVARVFLQLLLTVNYEEKRWKGILIKPGQRIINIRDFARECGLSTQSTRTAVNKLKSTQEITQEITQGKTLVTIRNWDLYQALDNKITQESTQELTNEQHTINTRLTQTKEKEEGKEEKKESLALAKSNAAKKKGTRFDPDFIFPQEWGEWAEQETGFHPNKVWDIFYKFRDYWISKAGQSAVKLDWFATWRNWVRKEIGK